MHTKSLFSGVKNWSQHGKYSKSYLTNISHVHAKKPHLDATNNARICLKFKANSPNAINPIYLIKIKQLKWQEYCTNFPLNWKFNTFWIELADFARGHNERASSDWNKYCWWLWGIVLQLLSDVQRARETSFVQSVRLIWMSMNFDLHHQYCYQI